ncbi:uncharacterized protein LOC118510550 isoform X2 [Anopheles stephensi]|uniref:uncharacterized protein LOC118510550 isoform X2 n=1 Tax=Anopheles stephensi TaxID=30069 RepID=UPI00165880CC|nr:uncharacterized protein LOC118510550 isoform X2 [Anopheles stephensi]
MPPSWKQLSLMRLILRAQSKLTKSTSNRKRGNVFCSRILILQNGMKIAPFDLFDFDMEYFFGVRNTKCISQAIYS